jgi:predicted RNase H-like nuclease (RuvC/YqgF family)
MTPIEEMEKQLQIKSLETSMMSNELKIMKLTDEINRVNLAIEQQKETINKLNKEF